MDMSDLLDPGFRGCVLVAEKGRTVFQKAFGFADLPNRVPNTTGTKFATASAGKVFVAVGILQLVEKGLLRLDGTLGELLAPDLKKIDRQVSVAELLAHTSGVPDYFDESVMTEYEDLWADFPNYRIRSNRDLLPLFVDKPMCFSHGSRFQYNNAGYVLLALVLEAVTGTAFDEYLQKNVFDPCTMAHTGYYELDRLPAKCAVNYIPDRARGGYRTNIFSVDAKGTGAGGAFTTVGDIKLFWEHLTAGRLLSPGLTAEMMKDHSGGARCYGYGLWLKTEGGGCIPYVQGRDPGVSFLSRYNPAKGRMVTLVSNYGDPVGPPCQRIEARLEQLEKS